MRTTAKQQRDALQARLAASLAENKRMAEALADSRFYGRQLLWALALWNGVNWPEPIREESPA